MEDGSEKSRKTSPNSGHAVPLRSAQIGSLRSLTITDTTVKEKANAFR